MAKAFVTKLPIKNKRGEVVAEVDVITYAGLLDTAHKNGLEALETELVQVPSEANGLVCVFRATARGRKGTYTSYGDAHPGNVAMQVARHFWRVAETRAKARALRDYVNEGAIAAEELGEEEDDGPPRNVVELADVSGPASDAQRRLLYRLCLQLGHEGDAATRFVKERLGIADDRAWTKREVGRLLDELEAEVRRASRPGGSRGA